MADQILSELWEIKDGLSKECGHDLRRLFDKLKDVQKSSRGPLVNRTKQRPETTAGR
jgi:hypothetical protein